MSADPNKKSARTFQCRDVLWDTFEQMARELECSVDYLVNEAMKQYARQRSYGSGARAPVPPLASQSVMSLPSPLPRSTESASDRPPLPTPLAPPPLPPPPMSSSQAPLPMG